jgi:hypothetical protein
MKKRKFLTLFLVLTIVVSTFVFFMLTTNAASSTHEAEDDGNNFKYASVVDDYVEFDATKNAYIEMKNVNSPASGTVTLTFVYSKSSSDSVPVEVKVNGTTVVSKEAFDSTNGDWAEKSIEATMESGSSNKIRFKLREAVEGVNLDKVIISTDGSDSDDSDSDDSDDNSDDDSDNNDDSDDGDDSSDVTDGDIVLEPNGSTSLQSAINSIETGGTIYLKAGTYDYSSTITIEEGNNGSSGNLKSIKAYGDGTPIVDFSAMSEDSSNRGIVLAANYWEINGITILGAGDNGMLLAGSNNTIDNCTFRENHDSGLQLSRYNTSYDSIDEWPSNNLIVNCLSTENIDSGREDADGYAPKLTCGEGNVFRSCVAKYNCDDGWDLYTKESTGAIGVVTLEDCESIGNGKFTDGSSTDGDGNGYKLGDDTASVAHILIDCVATNNRKHGFTGNGNPAAIILDNCSGSGNGEDLFNRLDNAIFY